MNNPLVTVLLPIYNGEKHIKAALQSIIDQKYSHLEILIIDDGCTDNSVDIINQFKDSRINLISNPENIGLIKTLNKGLKLAKGEYIARMDADDYSYPDRIQLQVNLLESNPKAGICGTWFETYINNKFNSDVKYSTENSIIKLQQYFQIHLCHGTALFRKSVLINNNLEFDIRYKHAEDYELWSRLKHHCEMVNIPKILYRVYQHGENVSLQNSDTQISNTLKVTKKQIEELIARNISNEEVDAFVKLCYADFSFSEKELDSVGLLLSNFIELPNNKKLIDGDIFNSFWKDKWNNLCLNQTHMGQSTLKIWNKYSSIKNKDLSVQLKIRIKSILKK